MIKKNLILFLFSLFSLCGYPQVSKSENPNIILILTDDQGIGDVGYMGNPYIQTPTLDSLAGESTRFTNYYVSPVCAPTRASMLTGKFSEFIGVYDTYNGGAILPTSERTIAEILSENGYDTGIIGKWHLGDNYPFRPIDQGFKYSLIHKAGGIGQPGDVKNFFKKDSSYFNPTLWYNEKPVNTEGYCTDVFFGNAIDFVKKERDKPFFLYLALNIPHSPLQLPMEYYDLYKDLNLKDYNAFIKGAKNIKINEQDLEKARRVYGMLTNFDDNLFRLIKSLKKENLTENTILIFLSDNGPASDRYKRGLRGRKGSVYEGGINVPFFINGTSLIPKNRDVETFAAHVDLLPTILDLAGMKALIPQKIQGKSMLPAIQSNQPISESRLYFTEWGRGFPVPYENVTARKNNFKLVGNTGYNAKLSDFELYDLSKDPYENENIIDKNEEISSELLSELNNWYKTIQNSNVNHQDLRIKIDAAAENPAILNRNDAKGSPNIWTQEQVYGYWDVNIERKGLYNVKYKFIHPIKEGGDLHLRLYPYHFRKKNNQVKIDEITMEKVPLESGQFRLEAYYDSAGKQILPLYVEVEQVK